MQAQAQHPAFKLVLKLALAAALLAVAACPSPNSFEPGNDGLSGAGPSYEAQPRPSGVPEGDVAPPDVGSTSPGYAGEGPVSEAMGRPPIFPGESSAPPDVGTTSPGLSYDCSQTGLHLQQVDLASIKAFMDSAYQGFIDAQRSGDTAVSQERYSAYMTAKTDLDLKRWRCFNCPGEIGCS